MNPPNLFTSLKKAEEILNINASSSGAVGAVGAVRPVDSLFTPVVELFQARLGKDSGLVCITQLVASLLMCGLEPGDNAFTAFMNLFSKQVQDETHFFDEYTMTKITMLLSKWSKLLKSSFFTSIDCDGASMSSPGCASGNPGGDPALVMRSRQETRNYKNALYCSALYLQERNILTEDTVETLLESVKKMRIFQILYAPPPHAELPTDAETNRLIKLAETTFQSREILPFDKVNEIARLPYVIILVNECSQPPRASGRMFAEDSKRTGPNLSVSANTSQMFPDDMHEFMSSTFFHFPPSKKFGERPQSALLSASKKEEQRKLIVKNIHLHTAVGAEIKRQKQIMSTQTAKISNALDDAKGHCEDALDALDALERLTQSKLREAKSFTEQAEAAANIAEQSNEKVKEAVATIISSCGDLYQDDVEVISENRTAKTSLEADAAIQSSLQVKQKCEEEVGAQAALIQSKATEARSYATAARTAFNAANQLVPVVPTKTAAQKKIEKQQAAADAEQKRIDAAAAALKKKQEEAAAAAEQKQKAAAAASAASAAALKKKQEEAAAAAEQKQKAAAAAALKKKQEEAAAAAKSTIEGLLTRVDANVVAKEAAYSRYGKAAEAAYSRYGKAAKEAAETAAGKPAAAAKSTIDDLLTRVDAHVVAEDERKSKALQQAFETGRQRQSENAAVAVDANHPSVTGIDMGDFQTLFTCDYQTMIETATRIRDLKDESILLLLQSNPSLSEYMMFDETSSRIFLVVGILQQYIRDTTTRILVTGKTALQLTAVLNGAIIEMVNRQYPPLPVDALTAPGVNLLRPCTDFDMCLVTSVPATPSLKKTFFGTILLFFNKYGILHNIESRDIPSEKYDKFLVNPNTFLTVLSRGSPNTISLKKSLGLRRILDILDVKFQTYQENRLIFPNLVPTFFRMPASMSMLTFMLPDLLSILNECIQITIKESTKLLANKRILDSDYYFFVITTLLKFFSRAVQLSYIQANRINSTRFIFFTAVALNRAPQDIIPIITDLLNLFLVNDYILNAKTFHDFGLYKATDRLDWKTRKEMDLHKKILGILQKYDFVPPPENLMGGKKNKLKTKRKARKLRKTRKPNKSKNNKKKRFTRNIPPYKLTNKSRGRKC
jgi:hypothetical protein